MGFENGITYEDEGGDKTGPFPPSKESQPASQNNHPAEITKRIAIFGADNEIGKAVYKQLASEGSRPIAIVQNSKEKERFIRDITIEMGPQSPIYVYEFDVTLWSIPPFGWGGIEKLRWDMGEGKNMIDGFVYAIGHYKAEEFADKTSIPLSEFDSELFSESFDLLVDGFRNAFRALGEKINPDGHIVVVGSTVTDPLIGWLPKTFLGHYACAQAAQAELVRWMKRDPVVVKNQIKVHRLPLELVAKTVEDGSSSGQDFHTYEEAAAQICCTLLQDQHLDELFTTTLSKSKA